MKIYDAAGRQIGELTMYEFMPQLPVMSVSAKDVSAVDDWEGDEDEEPLPPKPSRDELAEAYRDGWLAAANNLSASLGAPEVAGDSALARLLLIGELMRKPGGGRIHKLREVEKVLGRVKVGFEDTEEGKALVKRTYDAEQRAAKAAEDITTAGAAISRARSRLNRSQQSDILF